jgi:hypothetical protein
VISILWRASSHPDYWTGAAGFVAPEQFQCHRVVTHTVACTPCYRTGAYAAVVGTVSDPLFETARTASSLLFRREAHCTKRGRRQARGQSTEHQLHLRGSRAICVCRMSKEQNYFVRHVGKLECETRKKILESCSFVLGVADKFSLTM